MVVCLEHRMIRHFTAELPQSLVSVLFGYDL